MSTSVSSERFRQCSIAGCGGNSHYAVGGVKGYCIAHYNRFIRHGDPNGGGTSKGELLRWIHDVALNHVGDDCLAWPYNKGGAGYGKIKVSGMEISAPRYVCILAHGEPPTPKHEAAHSCGKGHEACVAPSHLSWKTPAENQADRVEHGTHKRGERQWMAKLTESNVREILLLKGVETRRNLAEKFGVSYHTISDIYAGRNWAWLHQETTP